MVVVCTAVGAATVVVVVAPFTVVVVCTAVGAATVVVIGLGVVV